MRERARMDSHSHFSIPAEIKLSEAIFDIVYSLFEHEVRISVFQIALYLYA